MVNISDVIRNQYPHFLYIRTSGAEATQDEDGSWVTPASAWTFHSRSREETNGIGSTVQAANGVFVTFSSLIQLPAGTPRVAEGTEIAVTDRELLPSELSDDTVKANPEGIVRVSGTCQKFDLGRLHCRLWV